MDKNDDKLFFSYICGKLLGDGTLSIKKNARLQFRHTIKDKEYAIDQLKLFSQFLSFGSSNPYEYSYIDNRTSKKYTTIICQSHTDSRLTKLRNLWYNDKGTKIIPKAFVKEYLNESALSIWYQDDGSLKNSGRLILSTESFKDNEIDFLRRVLLEKFKIESNMDSQRRIDISSRIDVELFLIYVEPYLSNVMKRKFLQNQFQIIDLEIKKFLEEGRSNQLLKRTTIYVPREIKHRFQKYQSPSEMINTLLKIEEELKRVHDSSFRKSRILAIKTNAIFELERVPYTIYLTEFNHKGLKLLKKLTGIELSDYITLFLT
ncbi:MAG: hypothetical protein ACH0QD_07740 [Tepidibacillus sp.]